MLYSLAFSKSQREKEQQFTILDMLDLTQCMLEYLLRTSPSDGNPAPSRAFNQGDSTSRLETILGGKEPSKPADDPWNSLLTRHETMPENLEQVNVEENSSDVEKSPI